MDIEKKKVIYKINTNIVLMRVMLVFMICVSTTCAVLYSLKLYNLQEDNFESVYTMFIGVYFHTIALNGISFLRTWDNKSNNNFYDIYAIVPVKREYIIKQDFKIWKYIPIFSGVLLTMVNTLYFFNPEIKEISGYFVTVTITSIMIMVFDYFARFHRKKVAGILKLIWVIMSSLIICLNAIDSVKSAFIDFLRLDIFKYMAGIPMIVISLMIIPTIFVLHYKYTCRNNKKLSAWY